MDERLEDVEVVLRRPLRGPVIMLLWVVLVFAVASYSFVTKLHGAGQWLCPLLLALLVVLYVLLLARRGRKDIRLTSMGFSSGRLSLRWDQVDRLSLVTTSAGSYGRMSHWIGVWPIAGAELPRGARLTRLQRRVMDGAPAAVSIDGFPGGAKEVANAFARFHVVDGYVSRGALPRPPAGVLLTHDWMSHELESQLVMKLFDGASARTEEEILAANDEVSARLRHDHETHADALSEGETNQLADADRDVAARIPSTLDQLVQRGLLDRNGDRYTPTREGLAYLKTMRAEAVAEDTDSA